VGHAETIAFCLRGFQKACASIGSLALVYHQSIVISLFQQLNATPHCHIAIGHYALCRPGRKHDILTVRSVCCGATSATSHCQGCRIAVVACAIFECLPTVHFTSANHSCTRPGQSRVGCATCHKLEASLPVCGQPVFTAGDDTVGHKTPLLRQSAPKLLLVIAARSVGRSRLRLLHAQA